MYRMPGYPSKEFYKNKLLYELEAQILLKKPLHEEVDIQAEFGNAESYNMEDRGKIWYCLHCTAYIKYTYVQYV